MRDGMTALRVCHIKRMHSHRTFSGLDQKGKTTMGWFYGFKLHLIIDDRGEILNFMITPGNTDDREPLRNERYVQDIRGKLCGDRGYIGKALFEMLFINGIQLVTRVRNNMKNIAQIEHSMQRTFNESFADTPSLPPSLPKPRPRLSATSSPCSNPPTARYCPTSRRNRKNSYTPSP